MDRRLALLLFILSVAGLVVLKPRPASLGDGLEVGKAYYLCGVLIPVKQLEKGCIMRFLDGEDEITAVQFFDGCEEGYRCFYGRISVYRGNKEVVVLEYT